VGVAAAGSSAVAWPYGALFDTRNVALSRVVVALHIDELLLIFVPATGDRRVLRLGGRAERILCGDGLPEEKEAERERISLRCCRAGEPIGATYRRFIVFRTCVRAPLPAEEQPSPPAHRPDTPRPTASTIARRPSTLALASSPLGPPCAGPGVATPVSPPAGSASSPLSAPRAGDRVSRPPSPMSPPIVVDSSPSPQERSRTPAAAVSTTPPASLSRRGSRGGEDSGSGPCAKGKDAGSPPASVSAPPVWLRYVERDDSGSDDDIGFAGPLVHPATTSTAAASSLPRAVATAATGASTAGPVAASPPPLPPPFPSEGTQSKLTPTSSHATATAVAAVCFPTRVATIADDDGFELDFDGDSAAPFLAPAPPAPAPAAAPTPPAHSTAPQVAQTTGSMESGSGVGGSGGDARGGLLSPAEPPSPGGSEAEAGGTCPFAAHTSSTELPNFSPPDLERARTPAEPSPPTKARQGTVSTAGGSTSPATEDDPFAGLDDLGDIADSAPLHDAPAAPVLLASPLPDAPAAAASTDPVTTSTGTPARANCAFAGRSGSAVEVLGPGSMSTELPVFNAAAAHLSAAVDESLSASQPTSIGMGVGGNSRGGGGDDKEDDWATLELAPSPALLAAVPSDKPSLAAARPKSAAEDGAIGAGGDDNLASKLARWRESDDDSESDGAGLANLFPERRGEVRSAAAPTPPAIRPPVGAIAPMLPATSSTPALPLAVLASADPATSLGGLTRLAACAPPALPASTSSAGAVLPAQTAPASAASSACPSPAPSYLHEGGASCTALLQRAISQRRFPSGSGPPAAAVTAPTGMAVTLGGATAASLSTACAGLSAAEVAAAHLQRHLTLRLLAAGGGGGASPPGERPLRPLGWGAFGGATLAWLGRMGSLEREDDGQSVVTPRARGLSESGSGMAM